MKQQDPFQNFTEILLAKNQSRQKSNQSCLGYIQAGKTGFCQIKSILISLQCSPEIICECHLDE